MVLTLDHLVWFSKDPVHHAQVLKGRGLHVVEGGHHKEWGTYNTLSYTGLHYIEFLGVENVEIARKAVHNQLAQQLVSGEKEGPARIACRTTNIVGVGEKLREKRIQVDGPYPGSRTTPDGKTIKWQLLFPKQMKGKLNFPFFIQWSGTDDDRKKSLIEQGNIAKHPIGPIKFDRIDMVVHHLADTTAEWTNLFPIILGEKFMDPELNAECQIVQLSNMELCFCMPVAGGRAEQILNDTGERPFRVSFSHANAPQEFELANGIWHFK